VTGQVVPANAAASVRGLRRVVKGGKTPMLDRAEAPAKWGQSVVLSLERAGSGRRLLPPKNNSACARASQH